MGLGCVKSIEVTGTLGVGGSILWAHPERGKVS